MRSFHCKWAWCAALALAPLAARAQQPTSPGAGAESFTVFVRGTPIGSEQVAVLRTADGWTVASSSRLGAPVDVASRRVQVLYDANWNPRSLSVDATVRGQTLSIQSSVAGTTATTHVANGTQAADRTDTIAPDTLLLPSPFWGPFEAVAARLKDAPAGTVVHAFAP